MLRKNQTSLGLRGTERLVASQKLSEVIRKIGRAYHNANMSKFLPDTNACLFIILSARFQKNN